MASDSSIAIKLSDTVSEEEDHHTHLLAEEGLEDGSNSASPAGAVSKLRFLILPLMFLLSFVSYLDRTNLAFVADDMQDSLGLNDTVYSLGAGFFFVTYGSMQIPSNRLLTRFGGVSWISFLAVSWGLSTCGMALITGEWSFYLVRATLGFFEAGFFPGTMVYLRSFFATEDFGFAYSVVMSATCLALMTGGPVIAGIEALSTKFVPDFDTWRTCFIVQGGAAAFVGVLLYVFQPRDIQSCKSLTPQEKTLVTRQVNSVKEPPGEPNLREVMSLSTLWYFSIHWLVFSLPYWGFIYWAPKIIDEIEAGSVSSTAVLFLSSIPYTGAVMGNLTIARLAEKYGPSTRFSFVGFAMFLAAFGFFLGAVSSSKTSKLAGLTIAGAGLWGSYGPLWSMISQEASSTTDKGSYMAAVNGIGTIGGFIGPYVVSAFDTRAESFAFFSGCAALSMLILAGAVKDSKSGLGFK
ncbi:hypothetical protein TrVE_jg9448 [Triparma verrucosa]|uniref:Major facilitator superfamily (MFS) profile domain-containing protein n=1 Tax=Triparma verrucosa TaxID=1606542 RepID=A0A9W7C093_9STRA|nr:hypothetical protein TrVE_jg9448 [Triparma verrucosa]